MRVLSICLVAFNFLWWSIYSVVSADGEASFVAAKSSGVAEMNAYVGAAERLEKIIHEHSGSKVM